MLRLELTLPTPAENVALDEALLDWAEDENPDWEFLRIWESPRPMVVVGRSSRVYQEVDVDECGKREIPILRRSSGGAAIVAGPGCLMYALVLSYQQRPELKDIRRAHQFVLGRLADAFAKYSLSVVHAGTSDLAIADCEVRSADCPESLSQSALRTPHSAILRKFSGNSLRAKRSHMLYHGTLLYGFHLPLIEQCLLVPPRVPEYRAARPHTDFVMNLPVTRESLTSALDGAWPNLGETRDWPAERVATLVAERYVRESWTYEFR